MPSHQLGLVFGSPQNRQTISWNSALPAITDRDSTMLAGLYDKQTDPDTTSSDFYAELVIV
jgi:hypothetical protein